MKQREEGRRLAAEQAHVGEELQRAHGYAFAFGWADEGARRQLAAEERAWLRHDEAGLKIFSGEATWKRAGVEVGKTDLYKSNRIRCSQRRRIAGQVRPGLEVHGFCRPDADEDAQYFC